MGRFREEFRSSWYAQCILQYRPLPAYSRALNFHAKMEDETHFSVSACFLAFLARWDREKELWYKSYRLSMGAPHPGRSTGSQINYVSLLLDSWIGYDVLLVQGPEKSSVVSRRPGGETCVAISGGNPTGVWSFFYTYQ